MISQGREGMESGAAAEVAVQRLAPLSAQLCGRVAVTTLPCKSLAPVKSTAFTGHVLFDIKRMTALKQHFSPIEKNILSLLSPFERAL